MRRLNHLPGSETPAKPLRRIQFGLLARVLSQKHALGEGSQVFDRPRIEIERQNLRIKGSLAVTLKVQVLIAVSNDKHQIALSGSQHRLIPVHDVESAFWRDQNIGRMNIGMAQNNIQGAILKLAT